MLSSVNSIVLSHNPVISSKPVNLSINILARIENPARLNYYEKPCFLCNPVWEELGIKFFCIDEWIENNVFYYTFRDMKSISNMIRPKHSLLQRIKQTEKN